jgi:hypothetical protein
MVSRDNTPGLRRGETQGHRNLSPSHVKSVVKALSDLVACPRLLLPRVVAVYIPVRPVIYIPARATTGKAR